MSKEHKAVSSGARLRLALLTALAAFALSLLPMSGNAAAVPAATQSWPEHLARPVPASCPVGETLIAPTSGWTDDLGVSHVTYKMAFGFVSTIPPEGLTADKVTTTLLADVGMPAPAGSSSYQRRVRQVLALARDQRAPQFCRSTPVPATAMLGVIGTADSPVLGVQESGNWAGYATTQAERGTSITDVFGAWTVPKHTGGGTPSAEGTWVGIGGGADGEANPGLIQTGTAMETNEGYRSFIEFVGGSSCTYSFCGHWSSVNAVSPGDSVTGEVLWEGSTTACFYFEDLSRSSGAWNTCGPVASDYGIPRDTTSAEWINEWPLPHSSSGFPYYDNPHTVYWSAMLAGQYGSSLTSPFSNPWTAEVMVNPKLTSWNSPYTCANDQWVSIPVDAATNSSGVGTSQTITCYIAGVVSGP